CGRVDLPPQLRAVHRLVARRRLARWDLPPADADRPDRDAADRDPDRRAASGALGPQLERRRGPDVRARRALVRDDADRVGPRDLRRARRQALRPAGVVTAIDMPDPGAARSFWLEEVLRDDAGEPCPPLE